MTPGRDLLDVAYSSPIHQSLPAEVVSLDELRDRMRPGHLAAAQRPTFGVLLVVHEGTGTHAVDFDEIELQPDRAVFVRPGQVQRWQLLQTVVATAVLAQPELCWSEFWFPGDVAYRDLGVDDAASMRALVDTLQRTQRDFRTDPTTVRLVADLVSAMLGVFERAESSESATRLPEAYVAFRHAIEADLARSRDARDFMRDLAWSERTINRACQQVTGRTAKRVLDERVTLEARRLLAHTDRPVGSIGRQLGFSEPSNFNKFFRRTSGELPAEMRARLRKSGLTAQPS